MAEGNSRIPLLFAMLVMFQVQPAWALVKERTVSIATKSGPSLTGVLYAPQDGSPSPGVLILHTAGGLSQADQVFAKRLAESGFAVLTIAYSIGWAAPVNEQLAEAVDWLNRQPESQQMPVGVVGFSLGASKALLVAALRPKTVKAVVAYYGTYNVEISKFKQAVQAARSKTGLEMPSPVQVVSKIDGAILLLQGEKDDETPESQTQQMRATLNKSGKTYEIVIYPNAYHMFEREPQFHPSGFRTRFGTKTEYNPHAAQQSWEKSLSWLQQHLKSTAPRRG